MTSEDQDPARILQRMVLEVFGERDAARRAAAVRELFASDATFNDAEASVTGHEAIDATAGRIHRALLKRMRSHRQSRVVQDR